MQDGRDRPMAELGEGFEVALLQAIADCIMDEFGDQRLMPLVCHSDHAALLARSAIARARAACRVSPSEPLVQETPAQAYT